MGAVAAPNADPAPGSHDTEPGPAADSPRPPSSLCSSPGSLPPDSLQAFPGLDSPSIQCDSLECPPCSCRRCRRRSAGSAGASEDSLQGPPARASATRGFASSDLSDSLESFIQHDSLQSLSSLAVSSSSISGDSLESLSSLSLGTTSPHSDLEFIGD